MRHYLFLAAMLLVGCGESVVAPEPGLQDTEALSASGPVQNAPTAPSCQSYPIITGTTNVYYVWYGNWSGNTATTILTDLANTIGGSGYYGVNTTYRNSIGIAVSNSVHYGGSTTDNYSQGTSLTDAGVLAVVSSAITSGRLPKDTNGVYFVLSSADVNETSGFCTMYCGWHNHGTISGSDIKYAFVGNAARCPAACAPQTAVSPNGNVGADGMAMTLASTLSNTVVNSTKTCTDPHDVCAWTFGTTLTASNGAKYNVTLGSRQYLFQRLRSNATGVCVLSL